MWSLVAVVALIGVERVKSVAKLQSKQKREKADFGVPFSFKIMCPLTRESRADLARHSGVIVMQKL